jgi:hypothetical protein
MTTASLNEIDFDSLESNPELAKQVQEHLIKHGYLDPPANGSWGPQSKAAIADFGADTAKLFANPSPINLGNDFASRIVQYMLLKNYFLARGERRYNIIYIEGINPDGTLNNDRRNQWNDLRLLIEIATDTPKIVDSWKATTEPGERYTLRPMNSKGAARIAFNQYKAWKIGTHGQADPHEALVQTGGEVTVHRDRNKDFKRTGDSTDTGFFGINQHWGGDAKVIGPWSAGCLVGQTRQGHREFMRLVKQDKRYAANNRYTFMTAILPGNEL